MRLLKPLFSAVLAVLSCVCSFAWYVFVTGSVIAVSALTIFTVLAPDPTLQPGVPLPKSIHNSSRIDDLIPHTKWSHLKPCGVFLNEQEEFKRARTCAQKNTLQFNLLPIPENALPPRCFVVSTDSPNVLEAEEFNGIPLITIFGAGMVVGFYQEETETVFVVENVDIAQVYRHELQHHFQHLAGFRVDHTGDVWNRTEEDWVGCEAPYYTPSSRSKTIKLLLNHKEDL